MLRGQRKENEEGYKLLNSKFVWNNKERFTCLINQNGM